MLEISIPGHKNFMLNYLVLDHNGTLACDGNLLKGVEETLKTLSDMLEIHVLTADTFGIAEAQLKGIPCRLTILPADNQDKGKLEFINSLGSESTACIGNGRNDRLMLRDSALGICVIQEEGASSASVIEADIVCRDILSALELFTNPLRMVATLRS